MKTGRFAIFVSFVLGASAVQTWGASGPTLQQIDFEIEHQHWNQAVESAQDLLAKDPSNAQAKLKEAYALFERGFPSSALLVVNQISVSDWQKLPQGPDRFAEVVSLLQKQVPSGLIPSRLDQIRLEQVPDYLHDEMTFLKGRGALERGDTAGAKPLLQAISQRSRFFAQARYLLGTIALRAGNLTDASAEFSHVFDPSVFQQSTEIWEDSSAQMTSHWGANLKVILSPKMIVEDRTLRELGELALARISYAKKDYPLAIEQYGRLDEKSRFFARATLEKIWSLLSLGRHEDAQKMALQLSVSESGFESIEAHIVRALVLTDAARTDEARDELTGFMKAYPDYKKALALDYDSSVGLATLPPYLKRDVETDMRIQGLLDYQAKLKAEIEALRAEDYRLFPAYQRFASSLDPLLTQSKLMLGRFVQEHVVKRRRDLARLYLQARLIRAETYLEDREKLRAEFKKLTDVNEEKQLAHDTRLAELLGLTVKEIDDLLADTNDRDPRLLFRQSEILWELAGATIILGQAKHDERQDRLAEEMKLRSLKLARSVAEGAPQFEKRAQVLFFIGFALSTLGREGEAVAALQNYVRTYPNHANVPDAYRIMADYRFDANDFRGAMELYRKVLEFPDSPVMGYALYKIGWCAYNLKDFARALLGLEKAVAWADRGPEANQSLSLQREARHDLIRLYAEVGDHRKAYDYFSQFWHGDVKPWLVDLAQDLDEMGQFEKSRDLYKALISMDPSGQQNALYQAYIVYGAEQMHQWPDAVAAAEELTNRYKGELVNPQGKDSLAAKVEKILRDAVLAQQFEYRKRPSPEAAERLGKLDELYLSDFEAWPDAEEPLYKHAHFLLDQHRTADAATDFDKHWTRFKGDLKEPLREESLRNLIHALNDAESAEKPLPGAPLSPRAARSLELSLEYEKDYPKSHYTRPVQYMRPVIRLKYGQTREAISECQALFDVNATDDVGQNCFKNLRKAYYDLKNWEETYRWASEMAARKSLGMSDYASDLKTIREETLFLWADATKDPSKAAAIFDEIAHDPSMAKLKDKSLYNAFVNFEKAGEHVKALAIADELEKSAPSFEALQSASGTRSALYQEAGDYERAWPLIETFLKHPDAAPSDALLQAEMNAGLMAEAMGKRDIALQHFRSYLKNGKGTPAGTEEAKRGIARLTESPKHEKTDADPQWESVLKMKKEFDRAPMPAGKDLAARIKKSAEKLEAVTKAALAFSAEGKHSAADAFEAYCTLPLLYARYCEGVMGLGAMKGLSDAERADLKTELARITQPIELKAKEMATECLSKSVQAEHDGPYYREVSARWGWLANRAQGDAAEVLLGKLTKASPWIDEAREKGSEAELLKMHQEGHGTEKSWYALAKSRWQPKRMGLARLTLVDALSKYPDSGALLNAIAMLEPTSSSALLAKAGEKGSAAAWVNLAILHLRGARLAPAVTALKNALSENAFRESPEIESSVKEFLKE